MVFLKSFLSGPDDFKKAFALSAAFHLLVASFFVFKVMFFSKPLIDLSQAITVNVGPLAPADKLPAKVIPAEPPAAEEPKPEELPEKETTKPEKVVKKEIKTVPKPDEINLAKAKQKKALDKLKKLSAIEKIKQDLAAEASKTKTVRKNVNAKPRVIAAGTALSGLDKLDANNYLTLIDYNIKQVWTLPQWLLNKNLKTQVLVKFNTQGQIISTQIISSSNNSTYDNYCLQAINKAAPFPKVPEKFSEKFSLDGLVIGFPE